MHFVALPNCKHQREYSHFIWQRLAVNHVCCCQQCRNTRQFWIVIALGSQMANSSKPSLSQPCCALRGGPSILLNGIAYRQGRGTHSPPSPVLLPSTETAVIERCCCCCSYLCTCFHAPEFLFDMSHVNCKYRPVRCAHMSVVCASAVPVCWLCQCCILLPGLTCASRSSVEVRAFCKPCINSTLTAFPRHPRCADGQDMSCTDSREGGIELTSDYAMLDICVASLFTGTPVHRHADGCHVLERWQVAFHTVAAICKDRLNCAAA